MKYIIITGCAGFIGSKLLKRIIKDGYYVIGIDNFFSGKRKNINIFNKCKNFLFFEQDIQDYKKIEEIFRKIKKIDTVIHLAAITNVKLCEKKPREAININYNSTINIINLCEALNIKNFIFAGSAAEFGNYSGPKLDGYEKKYDSFSKISVYANTKCKITKLIHEKKKGISLRLFNVYGPGQNLKSIYSGVITQFLYNAINNKDIKIFGDGSQTRDFVFINDVIESFIKIISFKKRIKGVYNIGNNKSISIFELAHLIKKVSNSKSAITFAKKREVDITHSISSGKKFFNIYGFKPQTSIRNGLKYTYNELKNKK